MNRDGGFLVVISSHTPWRTLSVDVLPTNTKCRPGGKFLMPRNFGVVVKERRSMPPSAEGGRFSRRIVGVGESILCASLGFPSEIVGGRGYVK